MNDSYRMPTRSLVKNDAQAMTERADIPRSRFLGSWTHNTTFNAGDLVPFLVDEVLPGDQMSYDVTAYLRMSTPLFPLFDNQKADTFFFFVPNRLVWDEWPRFMGEQRNPNDTTAFTVPESPSAVGGYLPYTIADYFGLPTTGQIDSGRVITANALPFRGYKLIWNEWFRDQNLQTAEVINFGTGFEDNIYCLGRAKMHDYFTSALPWPQKTQTPAVPMTGKLPVQGLGFGGGQAYNSTSPTLYQPGGTVGQFSRFTAVPDYGTMYMRGTTFPQTGSQEFPDVYVDLVNGAGLALNTLRSAIMVQSLYERDARGGTRYTEIVRSHFGVVSPDMRLQRPEYIGGGSSPIQLTPIAQTAPSVGQTVGALGAAGTSVGSHRASYAATEHGYIIGLINVQSEVSYQQGMARMWNRRTRFDFYFPALALLGEQAILRKELYQSGIPEEDNLVFGYQERWHEYRTRYSMVTSQFRSTMPGTLDAWHLSQRLNAGVALNGAFIRDIAPMARVLAAGQTATDLAQQYLANIYVRRTATRPLPMFSTPATLGRF
jgi:Capsid protein (F protein)